MKLVINRCYGGFGLSALAIKEYLKRKGKKAFFYKQTKFNFSSLNKKDEYTRIDNLDECGLFCYTFTKDLGKTLSKFPNNKYYFYFGNIERDDPDLVAVVKKLGKKADGKYAELSIVEIPDGIEWELSEYDGVESVEEKHRSWN